MPINLPIKKNRDADAQRQGLVGYDDDKIYPKNETGTNPYVIENQDSNASRVKSIFSDNFTGMSSEEISKAMLTNRLGKGVVADDFNPDFKSNSVKYDYDVEQVSANKNRAEDLYLTEEEAALEMTTARKAPNVSINASEYVKPFQTISISKGGFGNDALENSLHTSSSEGALDSIEVFEKYQ